MTTKTKHSILGILTLALFESLALSAEPAISPTQEFETATVPAEWKADRDGNLTVTGERFKSGRQSLRWNWRFSEATLEFHDAAAFGKRTNDSAFGLWVYNERAVAAPMRAELLSGNQTVASLWFWMDYKGWRPLGATYEAVGCKPGQFVDGIRFHAPKGIASGQLYLDCARFNFKPARADSTQTYQMPWSGHPDGLAHQQTVVLSDADICLNRPWLPARKKPDAITTQDRADLAKLAERLLPPLKRPASGLKPEALTPLRQRMAEYQIRRNGNRLTGRPIDSGSFVPPDGAIDLWDYTKFCADVQKAYFQAKEPGQLLELRQMFLYLAVQFLDQGFAEGTRLGGWANYPGQGLESFFLMRDVLAEAGLAREMSLALASYCACQNPGQYLDEKPGSSMDGLGFWNNNLLPCVLMLPDESERLQHVRTVQRFYSLALINPGTIGPDGCSYHHGGFHFAYASYNLPRLMRVLEKMADTEFRISAEAQERLKTYVHAIAFTLSGGEQPYNLGMRAGTPLHGNMAELAKTLALMGTPDGKQPLDREMAALYLNQTDQLDKEPAKSWIAQGIQPLTLTGHLTLNGAPLAVHRGADWLVGIAGISKFWSGLEIYGWTQSNNYARYARNGSVCLMSNGNPPSLAASGWNYDGWNWCHFPGTTALVRPSQSIFDGYAGFGNPSAFAGGTQLDGDGIWAMDFSGGDGVHFKKSVFCFDNRITVLTTDIKIENKLNAPAVTTLFQNSIQPGTEMVWLDGKAIDAFPAKRQVSGECVHWLMDNKGTGYCIPAGQDPIQLVCRKQEWTYWIAKYLVDPKNNPLPTNKDYQYFWGTKRDLAELNKHYRPSVGNFALAYFDHGINPTNAACAYTMVVKTSRAQLKAFARNAPNEVLRNDAHAHVLLDHASHTTAYALFTGNADIAAGRLEANNQPCFVMLRPDGPRLRVSVACTDIQRTQPIRLKLKGAWQVAGAKPTGPLTVTADGDDTRIELQPDYYMPMVFDMEPIKTTSER